jgi:hypothetical protein
MKVAAKSTSARISPPSLIPPGRAGVSLNAKMVDFAIHIEPSNHMQDAIHTLAQQSSEPFSANHTSYAPLRSRPIGISIETKLTGEKWEDAMIQIEIWAAAHFTKLEELVRDAARNNDLSKAEAEEDEDSSGEGGAEDYSPATLPFLPFVVVQGHDWNFLAATRDKGKRTCLYHKVTFGSTTSLLGAYQVICTIQLLAAWVRDSYTSWFEKACLYLPAESTSRP